MQRRRPGVSRESLVATSSAPADRFLSTMNPVGEKPFCDRQERVNGSPIVGTAERAEQPKLPGCARQSCGDKHRLGSAID